MYKDNESPQNKLLSINEVAKLLDVEMNTLRRWDKEGTLKAIQFYPRSPRKYKREDVERFINERK